MRGVFFIVILIAMLIVSYLVVKNMESTPGKNEVDKVEIIDRAKDVAKDTEKLNDLYQKRAGEIAP